MELVGCAARYADDGCAPPASGEVRVFVPGGATGAQATLAGQPAPLTAEAVPEGALLRITLPPVTADQPLLITTAAGRARFTIRPPEPAIPRERAAIEAALTTADAASRGPLLSALAPHLRRAGDMDGALSRFEEAEAAHRAVGRLSGAAAALEAQVIFALYATGRYDHARALLTRFHATAPDARDRAVAIYLDGLLAWRTGDPAAALRAMAAAAARQAQLGERVKVVGAREMQAVILRAMGRGDEALASLAALAEGVPADRPCERARIQVNTGWVQVLERMRHGRGPDPRPALRAAHAAYAEGGACVDEQARRNVALNLALAELDAGDPAETRRWLDTLPERPAFPVRLWRLDIEGRLALAAGDMPTATARFEALADLAGSVAPEAGWRAAVGLGDAKAAAGDAEGAIADWRRAEALLDSETLRLPLDGDRARFVVDRGRSARRLVDGLTRAGRPAEALCAARLARNRSLAALARRDRIAGLDPVARRRWDAALGAWHEARDRAERAIADEWQLAADARAQARAHRAAEAERVQAALVEALGALEQAGPRPTCADLRPPAPGELLLAWFFGEQPGAAPRLHGFAVSADHIRAEVYGAADAIGGGGIGAASDAIDGARRLAPFDDAIAAAERLRLITDRGAFGAATRIELHAARWRGRPLALAKPIAWALDLPHAARTTTPNPAALIVADPDANLPGARAEADRAATSLSAQGWRVASLSGGAAAGAVVRRRLGEVALLHYAGHGRAERADPWAAHLALAEQSRLSVSDLLALERGPRWAILSGCLTGLVDPRAAAGGIGIAQAFLLVGADGVLAATEEVDDRLASDLGVAVSAQLGAPDAADLTVAVHRARVALGERPGWSAFRVWVP